MADCKSCHEWYGSSKPSGFCPTCERAIKRLFGSENADRGKEILIAEYEGRLKVLRKEVSKNGTTD